MIFAKKSAGTVLGTTRRNSSSGGENHGLSDRDAIAATLALFQRAEPVEMP